MKTKMKAWKVCQSKKGKLESVFWTYTYTVGKWDKTELPGFHLFVNRTDAVQFKEDNNGFGGLEIREAEYDEVIETKKDHKNRPIIIARKLLIL